MPRTALTSRLAGLVLLLVAGAAGIVLATRAGGATAGVLAAVAVASAIALLLRADAGGATFSASAAFDGILIALPAALIIYASFESGGYFPRTPAVIAAMLLMVLILRVTLIDAPFAAFSRQLALAVVAFGGFATWILLSGLWSDAPGRAFVEFDRAFAYLLVVVLFGSLVRTTNRLRWLLAAVAAGALVVAVAALATRLAPDHFPTSVPAIGESNLAYPLTYSNALGILCVLGTLPCFYFATSTRQSLFARALASAAVPVFATTVYLTLSRGPVAAAIVGVLSFAVLGRPRGLVTGLVATLPTSVVAVASAYHHSLLTSATPQTPAAAAQGHRVVLVLALCVVAAAIIRVFLAPVDARLREFSLDPRRRRAVIAGSCAAVIVVLAAVALAADAPGRISDQYNRFVSSGQAGPTEDVRQSVFSSANRGLVDNWSVALDAFRDSPLHGQGAGTYEVYWNEHRPPNQSSYNVTDAHSLYVEVLGELGIVGFVLLVVTLLSFLAALLPFGRGANRPLYAALFSVVLAWIVHTGVDWDWEMPAVTVGVMALGGAGLAAHERTLVGSSAPQGARVMTGMLLLVAAVAPLLVFTSERSLNDARDALRSGRCETAIGRASDAARALEFRAEPYEVIALCQQRRGYTGYAIEAMRKASKRDPDNWRYHFELGALLGAASQNTRPELLRARGLNPENPEIDKVLKAAPAGNAVNWDLELLAPSGAIVNER